MYQKIFLGLNPMENTSIPLLSKILKGDSLSLDIIYLLGLRIFDEVLCLATVQYLLTYLTVLVNFSVSVSFRRQF